MKRATLAVLGLFFAAQLCMAQNWQARVQHGMATQELQTVGMSAAHSDIPVGSKVKITNPANGLDIEATIVDQIPESASRIIDLSPGAALALDLSLGGPVMITTLSIPPSTLPAAPDGVAISTSNVEIEVDADKTQVPFNITIYNYLSNPEKQEKTHERPVRQNRSDISHDEFVLNEASPAPKPVPVAVQAPAPAVTPLFDGPPVNDIQILPALPSPHDDKIYHLLVGAYPGVDSAARVYRQLQAAGFDVFQEQAGEMCKVYAAGIPASKVYYAAQRLGAIGFQQVWIHE